MLKNQNSYPAKKLHTNPSTDTLSYPFSYFHLKHPHPFTFHSTSTYLIIPPPLNPFQPNHREKPLLASFPKIPPISSHPFFQFKSLMSSFGIDLGGGQIKVCVWNGNRLSSTGVGAEIVENDRSERTSPYIPLYICHPIVPVLVSKIQCSTFAVSVLRMYNVPYSIS